MKKILSNNRLIAVAFFTIFSVAAAPSVIARENPVVPVTLVYVGKMKDQPVYQLNVAGNAEQNDFSVIIRDEYGNVLFWENIKSENFSKKFLFNTDEIGDNMLELEVISKKTRKSVRYEINRNIRFTEEMTVTKVK